MFWTARLGGGNLGEVRMCGERIFEARVVKTLGLQMNDTRLPVAGSLV